MFCPQCGKTNSAEQKFCRSCGLSLEKAAQSLAEQLPATASNQDVLSRQRLIERLITIILGSAFGVFVIAVLWKVVQEIIIVKGDVLEGVTFLGLFVAAVVALLLVIYRESLREASAQRRATQIGLPTETPTKSLRESELEPVPSVTERTTDLLLVDRENKPKQ